MLTAVAAFRQDDWTDLAIIIGMGLTTIIALILP